MSKTALVHRYSELLFSRRQTGAGRARSGGPAAGRLWRGAAADAVVHTSITRAAGVLVFQPAPNGVRIHTSVAPRPPQRSSSTPAQHFCARRSIPPAGTGVDRLIDAPDDVPHVRRRDGARGVRPGPHLRRGAHACPPARWSGTGRSSPPSRRMPRSCRTAWITPGGPP
jgi:hypothetical protein